MISYDINKRTMKNQIKKTIAVVGLGYVGLPLALLAERKGFAVHGIDIDTKKIENEHKKITVAVSGGFDPIHIGHVRMFEEAKKHGTHLVVIVNNDNWLRTKKGYVFMPETERVELIKSFACVDDVILTDHDIDDTDRTVCRTLTQLKPDVFANGGNRGETNTPEASVCEDLGIAQVYNTGAGGKMQSSSWLVQDALKGATRSVRPWGHFNAHDKGEGWYLKTITVNPGQRLSLQYHHFREEYWMLIEGEVTATLGNDRDSLVKTPLKKGEIFFIPQTAIHRLESETGGKIVEIALGNFDENDIIRLEDDYVRI